LKIVDSVAAEDLIKDPRSIASIICVTLAIA